MLGIGAQRYFGISKFNNNYYIRRHYNSFFLKKSSTIFGLNIFIDLVAIKVLVLPKIMTLMRIIMYTFLHFFQSHSKKTYLEQSYLHFELVIIDGNIWTKLT